MMETLILITVLSITDGDTIKAEIEGKAETIRLLSIDTPEIRGECEHETRLAFEAKGYVKGFLRGKRVEIQTTGDRDRYGRLLGKIYANGVDLGARIITEELAQPWPNTGNVWCVNP